jgi:Asp-tRNA(Asn)/Glu-tRNA(Gln) amidotransferase A subunit family amidase
VSNSTLQAAGACRPIGTEAAELRSLPAGELAASIARDTVSAREAVETYIARVEEVKRSPARSTTDDPYVASLRSAGAIVIAKTNVAQLLVYTESDNPLYGRTNNPWNLERSCGGAAAAKVRSLAIRPVSYQ